MTEQEKEQLENIILNNWHEYPKEVRQYFTQVNDDNINYFRLICEVKVLLSKGKTREAETKLSNTIIHGI